jgi:hypothetical protein
VHSEQTAKSANAVAFMIGVALCAWIFCESAAQGQFMGGGMGGGRGGRHGSGGKDVQSKPASSNTKVDPPSPHVSLTPHGGQYITTDTNYYEVVYMPLQTRIYLYDKTLKPLSAREVHVQMSPQLSGESAVRGIPFQYVALPPGTADQDYVAANFDLNQLPEEETPITFVFSGLQDRAHPTASFMPIFTRANIRPYVVQVLPTESDRDGIVRQRICPVSGDILGGKGPVVKLLIGEYHLYLCCKDCIAAVKQAPDKYLH